MRAKKLLKSGILILLSQFLCYVADFLCRVVFIHTISMDYVGVKGLFTNILSVLTISELGIGTVLVYAMYQPVAEKEEQKILALVSIYRKAYTLIAGIIFTVGLCLTPFLTSLIKDCPDLPDLTLIYLLYLGNTSVSFLFSSRQSIFNADQKYYINSLCYSSFNIIRDLVQIVFLFTTHNFIIYLIIQIFSTLSGNLFCSFLARKMYPFLKEKKRYSLSREELSSLKKNIFAMFHHRIGATILNSTDNIVISKCVSLTAVAVNDNYTMILNMINGVLSQLFSALLSSIGNLNVTARKEEIQKVFTTLHFMNFWFYTFCCAGLLTLLSPVITLIFGEKYVFPTSVSAILVVNFYIVGIRKIPLLFKESMGLLWQDRWKPLIEAVMNIIISVIAARYFGTVGVFIGTFISMVTTSLWVEPHVLFKYGFHTSTSQFWKNNVVYFLVSGILVPVTFWVGSLFSYQSIYWEIIIKLLLVFLIPNIGIGLCFSCTQRMTWTISHVLSALRKKTS